MLTGLSSTPTLFPGLPPWANLCRPYGLILETNVFPEHPPARATLLTAPIRAIERRAQGPVEGGRYKIEPGSHTPSLESAAPFADKTTGVASLALWRDFGTIYTRFGRGSGSV